MNKMKYKYKGVKIEMAGPLPIGIKMTYPDGKVVEREAYDGAVSYMEALGQAKYLVNQELRDFDYPAATLE